MIHLKAGREKSLRRRHPWLFSGAVERVSGNPKAGDTVDVRSSSGQVVARAAYSPASQIRARAWTFDPAEEVDAAFFRNRVLRALAVREALPAAKHSNALRLIHAESDGLPGLVVDRYADVLVAQFLAAGVERWRDPILDALAELTGCEAIYERSDAETRKLEGLEPRAGFVRGNRKASRCPIIEYGLNFRVDVEQGQKTGFFLDQRENRHRVRQLAAGREVLDGFSYTGGFAINALAGGAKHVVAIESSAPSLEVARENLAANAVDAAKVELVQADARSPICARCAIATRTSTSSCSIRRSSRRPRRRRRTPRAPTRTSTCWRSSCCGPAACWPRSRAQAASMRRSSSRSSPVPRSTRAAQRRSSSASAPPPIIPWRWNSPKANT